MAALSGHALFPSVLSTFLSGCKDRDMSGYTPQFFTKEEYSTIAGVIDIILPATNTKSASQVNTQVFLDQVFHQCLTADEQTGIKEGLKDLVPGFGQAPDKEQYVTELDKKAYSDDKRSAYFKTIKQYTMIGYFTSEEGETKASNYVKVPDGYKGDIAMDANTLNYGKTFLHY